MGGKIEATHVVILDNLNEDEGKGLSHGAQGRHAWW
jgi:hypothetical protein